MGGDGRRAWERKESEKRIAGDEVRRVNASGKRDCVSSKANNSLRRSAGVVRRRPHSHDKRNNVDRVKSDTEQDDSDCAHDSPVRRKIRDAFCSDSSSLSADSSSDTDASEYDCTHNGRSDAVSRAPRSRRKHVLVDADSMHRGRSRQIHDYGNDTSRGRRSVDTRPGYDTDRRRLYRDASPNVDAGDTTCYARVDKASGRAAENVRADRPKRDQKRDKKHNINVHRRLRFDDSCSELDDDDVC